MALVMDVQPLLPTPQPRFQQVHTAEVKVKPTASSLAFNELLLLFFRFTSLIFI